MSDDPTPVVADDRVVRTPPESAGTAPGRGRLAGRRILVVGAGQADLRARRSADRQRPGDRPAVRAGGARVVCADRDPASAEETVRRILDEGGQASEVVADVADPAGGRGDGRRRPPRARRPRRRRLQRRHRRRGTASSGRPSTWDTVMNVNLRGAMLTARAALPILADGAAMVFISSVAGIKPGSRIPVYDASKAALGGLVRHVAVEGERRSIRANIVAPGLMDTALGRMASQGRPSRARTPGAAGPPGHRVGDGVRRAVPAVGRVGLRHRPDARRRRRAAARCDDAGRRSPTGGTRRR